MLPTLDCLQINISQLLVMFAQAEHFSPWKLSTCRENIHTHTNISLLNILRLQQLWYRHAKTSIIINWFPVEPTKPKLTSKHEGILSKTILVACGERNSTPLQYFCLENPMGGGAWWAAVHGVTRVRDDWATSLPLFTFKHWRRKWQPTPVFLPGESQGRGSLVGCRLWGRESDTTEAT